MALLPAREFPPGRLRSSQVRLLKRYVVSLAVLQDLHTHRLYVVFCVAHLKLEKGTETDSFGLRLEPDRGRGPAGKLEDQSQKNAGDHDQEKYAAPSHSHFRASSGAQPCFQVLTSDQLLR